MRVLHYHTSCITCTHNTSYSWSDHLRIKNG
nr:MAG TPA: hypothetical protein [Caudoviricetes sp.]